VQKKIAKAA